MFRKGYGKKADSELSDQSVNGNIDIDIDNFSDTDDEETMLLDDDHTINALCTICLKAKADAMFLPCQHMCSCDDCTEKVKLHKQNAGIFTCGICRHLIEDVIVCQPYLNIIK